MIAMKGSATCLGMSLTLSACGLGAGTARPAEIPESPNAPDPTTADIAAEISERLQDQEFEEYAGPFADRTPAPAISSFRKDPVNALGSIFAKVAKPGKTCTSTDVTDYEFERIIEDRPEKCHSKAYPATTVSSMMVDGKAAADIEYIVGKAKTAAEYAYELIVSEPVTAALLNTSECVVESKIDKLKLPAQTCDLKYIAGVVVTQVSYRRYRRLDVEANASYVVKVGGTAYGSSEQLVNKWYMTVDSLDLTRLFTPDSTTGFLKKTSESIDPREFKAEHSSENERQFLLRSLEKANALDFKAEISFPNSI